jgi:hypothetical protein
MRRRTVLLTAILCAAVASMLLANGNAAPAGAATACSGSVLGGFFNHITADGISCAGARQVVRRWIRESGFKDDPEGAEGITEFGAWTCRLVIHQGRENPYGVIRRHASRGWRVRFLGTS